MPWKDPSVAYQSLKHAVALAQWPTINKTMSPLAVSPTQLGRGLHGQIPVTAFNQGTRAAGSSGERERGLSLPWHSWDPSVQCRIYDASFPLPLLRGRARGGEAEGSKGCGLDECAGFMQCLVTRLSEVVIPRAFP